MSAGPKDLFEVNKDCYKLLPDEAELFHTFTVKLLWIKKRCQPDMAPEIAFLMKWVQAPSRDDWRKLSNGLENLKADQDCPLILSDYDSGNLTWFVYATFAVHFDMCSHTSGGLNRRGFIITISMCPRLNTRSLMEAKLVVVDNCISLILWAFQSWWPNVSSRMEHYR